jgi:RNA polymerase sigma-70 factor (ECF subfamily)
MHALTEIASGEDRIGSISSTDLPEFSRIYRDHFRDVYRWAHALGGANADPEDIAQEVFIVVQRKLQKFDGANLKAWLYRITANTVSDQRRRAWFRHLFFRAGDDAVEQVADAHAGPSDLVEQRQAQRVLFDLAESVHKSRRETFLLFEVEGLSGEEIAEAQGVPLATVWTRLHLARKEFMSAAHEFREREGM